MAQMPMNSYDTEAADIDRRQRYAELLRQQGTEQMPAGQMAGRVFVGASPLAGLAKVLQSYQGAKGVADAGSERKALAGRMEGDRSREMEGVIAALRGQPAQPAVTDVAQTAQNLDSFDPRAAQAAVPGDPNQAAMAALGSQFGDIRGMAPGLMAMAPKPAQPYTLAPGAVRFGAGNKQLAAAPTATPQARPSQLATLQSERAALPPGDPRIQAYDNAIRKESETAKQISPTIVMPKPDKVPLGYRATADGALEPIPGGPADQKIQGALNQDTLGLQGATANFDRLATAANALKNMEGLKGITGLRGAVPNIPGSAAADAQAALNTLKSQVAFGVLQEMRNQSKTGGALGAVSEKELMLLQNNLNALDNAQSYDALKTNLENIVNYTEQAKDRMRGAYNMKHQGRRAGDKPAGASGEWKDL